MKLKAVSSNTEACALSNLAEEKQMGPRERSMEPPPEGATDSEILAYEMEYVEDEWYKDPYEDPDDPDGWSEFPDD